MTRETYVVNNPVASEYVKKLRNSLSLRLLIYPNPISTRFLCNTKHIKPVITASTTAVAPKPTYITHCPHVISKSVRDGLIESYLEVFIEIRTQNVFNLLSIIEY